MRGVQVLRFSFATIGYQYVLELAGDRQLCEKILNVVGRY